MHEILVSVAVLGSVLCGLALLYLLPPKTIDKLLLDTTPAWIRFAVLLVSAAFYTLLLFWVFSIRSPQALPVWKISLIIMGTCITGGLLASSFVASAAYFYERYERPLNKTL